MVFENVSQNNEIFKITFNVVMIKFIKNHKQLLKNKNLLSIRIVVKYKVVFQNVHQASKTFTIYANVFLKAYIIVIK